MDTVSYYFTRCLILVFRIIPFRLLYGFSDVVYFLIYHGVGYRKAVVYKNLRNSFPGKTEREITLIARKFYHHLCDVLVESMKAFSMTEEDVVKRYRFENPELMEDVYRKNRSVICVGAHYGNWEWAGLASGLQLKHVPVGFYKPLSNKKMDSYVRKSRVKGRSLLVSIANTPAVFRNDYGEPAIFYMVADQSPSSARLAYWMQFLNQDTAVLHGPEKYARIHNLPVVFAACRKVSRGRYSIRFSMLVKDPSVTRTGEITALYIRELEDLIRKEPAYYLWSHRRWKLTR